MGYPFSLDCYFWRLYIEITMITLIIFFLSIVALLFLVQQLYSHSPDGKFLKSIRDLLVIILSLSMTIGVFYVGFRLLKIVL
jgi:hypothetical protein